MSARGQLQDEHDSLLIKNKSRAVYAKPTFISKPRFIASKLQVKNLMQPYSKVIWTSNLILWVTLVYHMNLKGAAATKVSTFEGLFSSSISPQSSLAQRRSHSTRSFAWNACLVTPQRTSDLPEIIKLHGRPGERHAFILSNPVAEMRPNWLHYWLKTNEFSRRYSEHTWPCRAVDTSSGYVSHSYTK